MPTISTFSVDFPDGHTMSVRGPSDLTDTQVFDLALQERAVKEGRIQTTWFGGAAKQMGQERGANAAMISGVGALTAQPEIVAAAPLAARWIEYATQKLTGEQPELPSVANQAVDVAQGALTAYGPALISKAASRLAGSTVAHQLPNGRWVKGLKGDGVVPWAVREGSQAVNDVSQAVVEPMTISSIGKAARSVATTPYMSQPARLAAEAADLKYISDAVANGFKPTEAAMRLSQGNTSRYAALMNLYLKAAK